MKQKSRPINVLVSGGAGYIGSVATAILINRGYHVTVVDSFAIGHREAVHPEARFIEGDISDKKTVEKACSEGIDVVMHFAAFIEVGESVINPSKYYLNNFTKSLQFLNNLIELGVNKLVFSSTASVYGEPETNPLTEDAPLNPVNPYGRTKMMFEQVLRDYDMAYGFKSVCLRYFNAGGAYESFGEDHRPESHLLPCILNSVLSGSQLKVFGNDYDTKDGSCIRDYIHVKDIAEAHILAAHYLCEGGQSDCFNLGTGEGFTVLEVINIVGKVIGRHVHYSIAGRRDGDSAVLVASPEKAQHILGWEKNLTGIEEIVLSAWEWKQKFKSGYGE